MFKILGCASPGSASASDALAGAAIKRGDSARVVGRAGLEPAAKGL